MKYDEVLRKEKDKYQQEMKQVENDLVSTKNPIPGHNPYDLERHHQYANNQIFKEHVDAYNKLKHRHNELTISLDAINRIISKRSQQSFAAQASAECHIHTESHDVSQMTNGPIEGDTEQKIENIIDVGGTEADLGDSGKPISTLSILKTPLDLKDFFSRPVLIAQFGLTLNTALQGTYDVWKLFTDNPGIRAKLRNYAYLRGNLVLKIAMSGTPQHYGKILFSYVPLPLANDVVQKYLPMGTFPEMEIQYFSQCPGAKVLDVNENTPYIVKLPFVSPQPMMRLFNNIASALSASFNDAIGLGSLIYMTINNIKSVAASPSTPYVQIYAWMEDVELGCPTGSLLAITTESRYHTEAGDEREKGPVERIASKLAVVARALTSIPVIKPFADASNIVLTGVSNLAAIFGWSYPTLIVVPHRVKNEPFQNSAQTIGVDTGLRLTLDPKQELTVDPRFAAVEQDELTFAFITKVVSYLTTFTWAHTSVPFSSVLFRSVVSPRANHGLFNSKNNVQPTALGFCATPFKYWRGDITFRIEIVCSIFHRGKLLIYYEPNLQQQVLIDGDLNTNKQYARVIDIQETQTVDFCVEWAFPKPWALNLTNNDMATSVSDQFTVSAGKWLTCNGYIGIVPFTELQSPDNSDISINVYVYSENMHFNRFSQDLMPLSRQIASASRYITDEVHTESHDVGTRETTCIPLNPTYAKIDNLCAEYFGERPVSFRSLLKRFFMTNQVTTTASGTTTFKYNATFPIFPPLVPSMTVDVSQSPELLSYLRLAYLAMRGGIKRRLHVTTNSSIGDMDTATLSLLSQGTSTSAPGVTAGASGPVYYFMNGVLAYVPHTNAGIEGEIPFYSNNLFVFSCSTDPWISSGTSMLELTGDRNYEFSFHGTGSASDVIVTEACASGEDFLLARWIAAPPYTHT